MSGTHMYNLAAWQASLSHMLERICEQLHLGQPAGRIDAQLYKLLLYTPGSFFKPHRDSEKVGLAVPAALVCK